MHKRFNQNYICTDKISLFLLPLNFELFFYIKKEKKIVKHIIFVY